MSKLVSVSIVSHNQFFHVKKLLYDIKNFCELSIIEVIITINTPEECDAAFEDYPFNIVIVRNDSVRGFGENHNRAFFIAKGNYFCVMNPDIRLTSDPFEPLINRFSGKEVGVIAPLVIGGIGKYTDSARRFPSILSIFYRAFFRSRKGNYLIEQESIQPDWIAGMFLLFPSSVFRAVSGFDERYFLYFEDVDICARLFLKGYKAFIDPRVSVVHLEQRASHKELSHFYHHVVSMARFFLSAVYWKVIFIKFGVFVSKVK